MATWWPFTRASILHDVIHFIWVWTHVSRCIVSGLCSSLRAGFNPQTGPFLFAPLLYGGSSFVREGLHSFTLIPFIFRCLGCRTGSQATSWNPSSQQFESLIFRHLPWLFHSLYTLPTTDPSGLAYGGVSRGGWTKTVLIWHTAPFTPILSFFYLFSRRLGL
jgi:hypothetical protein